MPQFAHLPLLLKPEGTGKLSKRDADKQGFPIFPLAWPDPDTGADTPGFREEGYLPEALINFMALLGWNPGSQQEIFNKEDLIHYFAIEKVGKSGIKFDIQKAAWFNQQYLRAKPETALVAYLTQALEDNKIAYSQQKALQVCRLIKERVVFPQDFWLQGKYFFVRPDTYDEKILQAKWNTKAYAVLQDLVAALRSLISFQAESIREVLMPLVEARSIKINLIMPILRVALTGSGAGPDLMQSMELMGQEECMVRLETFLAKRPLV